MNKGTLSSQKTNNYPGEVKKPFENKNKHIRSKGPTPKTKRTIFAVLGVVLFSPIKSLLEELTLCLDFLLGIHEQDLKNYISIITLENKQIRKYVYLNHSKYFMRLIYKQSEEFIIKYIYKFNSFSNYSLFKSPTMQISRIQDRSNQ